MSNYDKEVLTASALLERLNTIEANATNIKHNFVGHTRALETKVKQLEDRAQAQRDESSHSEAESKVLGYRLDVIETDVKATHGRMITKVIHEDNNSARLNKIDSEIEVMSQIITKNTLALDEIEKRIAIMQEKIDGIN